MAGLISDIVGGNVDSDLDKLVAKLAAVEKELDVINGKAISIKVDLQGVGTLSELTNLYKQQDEILTKLRGTSVQYVDTYKMATEVIKQHNGHSKEFVAVSQGIAKTTAEEARARKENAKALLDEQKYVAALAKEKEALEKKTVKAQQAAEKENNAYLQLRKTYNEQSTALKGMIIQYGEADAAVVKMKADVDKMYTSLLKAEEAVGQHQRKVGQYTNLSNSFSQILREAPAFAYSFSTGIMGISNNIPPLLDDLKRLKQANKEAAEAGGEQKTTWDSLKESLFSVNGLITIGVGLFTILAARWDNATESMSDADIAAKELSDTISDLNNIVSKGYLQELTETNDLFRVSSDLGLSYDIRVKAIEDLMNLYPGLLSNLENEAFLTGNVAEKQDLIAKVISKKNYVKYYEGIAEEMTKQRDILQKKFDENNAYGFLGFYNPFSTKGTAEDIANQEQAIKKIEADIEDAKRMKKILQDELKYIMNPKHEGRILADIDADIREQQRKRDNNAIEKKEHIEAIARLKELEEERRKFLGTDKQKKPKKDTISDDLAAAKSDYELQLLLNQQKFVNSRDTDMAAQKLKDDNLKATTEYGERYIMIVEDFNNKHLITENEHIKLINEANKILLEGQIKAKEAGDKIEEERLKKSIEANKKLITYIESLSKQRQELEKINREIDNIQDKAASRKEYAESFAPYLEGFGFNNAFGQQVKQKNADISARRTELGVLEGNKPTEASDPKTYGMRLLQWETNIAKEKENIAKMEADRDEMYNQKMIEGKKELGRRTIELVKSTADAIMTIQQNAIAQDQKGIEMQQRALALRTQQELRSIDATTGFAISKTNEKARVVAQAKAKEDELQNKSNQLALKAARAQKQAAELSIITNTAASIIKAFVDFPYPVAIPIAAVLAATGAVQYAAAASAPLPQFEKGGTTSTEYFIAGEKGSELMVSPDGKVSMSSDTAKVHRAQIGTKIIPHNETESIIKYASQTIGMSQYDFSMMNAANHEKTIKEVAKIVGDKFEDVAQDIIHGMFAARPQANNMGQSYIDAVREQQNLISKL